MGAVYSTYNVVLATLQIIIEADDRVKAVEAEGILLQAKSFKFVRSYFSTVLEDIIMHKKSVWLASEY